MARKIHSEWREGYTSVARKIHQYGAEDTRNCLILFTVLNALNRYNIKLILSQFFLLMFVPKLFDAKSEVRERDSCFFLLLSTIKPKRTLMKDIP